MTMPQNITIASSNDLQSLYGQIIHKGVVPGFVVLSFIISYIGSWTTLELINRRTSSRGWYNWSLLGGAAIAMGGVGIACMHFIGNRAIILGDGSDTLQVSYSPGLTALSFFLPILVLFMAFAAVGTNDEVSLARLCMGGTLAGLGVCGMHYLGQASITNYDCLYEVGYIVGSAIIAIAAATVALVIFFVFRAAWNASWWKRGTCALILAGAVSGMHWLAFTGTQYRLREGIGLTLNNSRSATTISVIVLSIVGCLILFVSTLAAQAQKRRQGRRARQITLAAAVFDQDGKILVKADGLLPLKKITDAYRETDYNDVFGISHPAFLWMYRASRNWAGISNLIPEMREHLHRVGLRSRLGIASDNNFSKGGEPIAEYSIIFRELFCAAAAELADDMNHPVEKLGKLFDDIIYTGKAPSKGKKDLEQGNQDSVGKGQILFLVRVVDKAGAQQLQAAGYRFAPQPSVLPLISGILKIPDNELARQLDIMNEFAVAPPILDAGCHLALFAIRASMSSGFDVLIRQDARNLIPTMQLPFNVLESWQVDYLQTWDSQNVATVMRQLNKASKAASTPPKEKKFAAQVLHTLEAFKDEIDDPFFNDAMLIAKPVHVPCRGATEDGPLGSATLIVFRAIIPIQARAPGKKLDLTPLAFFKTRQHVYLNSRDHAVFSRRAYREFAPVLNLSGHSSITAGHGKEQHEIEAEDKALANMEATTPLEKPSEHRRFNFFRRRPSHHIKGDNSSEKNLVDMHSEDQGVGGIMVSQEVSIDVANRPASPVNKDGKKSGGIEMMELRREPDSGGAKVTKDEEAPSYVDELFKTTVQARTVK